MKVRISASAEQDLRDIGSYLVRAAGRAIAAQEIRRLRGANLSLSTPPDRGNVPPELGMAGEQRFRELHDPPYRIIYHLDGDTVRIDVVADARRDFRTLLERRLLRP